MRLPTAALPVNDTPSTSASMSASPTGPSPMTSWSSPGGSSFSKIACSLRPTCVESSLGFHTTALPASSAGTSARSGIEHG